MPIRIDSPLTRTDRLPFGDRLPNRGDAGLLVGVFDSGVGGLTVVREIVRRMPAVSVLYVADFAHVPYGPRPASDIRTFAHGIAGALLTEGACAVVAACNMSSALALPAMEPDFPTPLIGMIRPGVRAALTVWTEGPIGVLATEGTCRSGAYPSAAGAARPGLTVVQSACPDFVPLVESRQTDGGDARDAAERYLRPLLAEGCRTIILGCTHYPWLLGVLRSVAGPGITFVDPASAAVDELKSRLAIRDGTANSVHPSIDAPDDRAEDRGPRPRSSHPHPHRFAATAHPERLESGLRRWLGLEAEAELWPLWESSATVAPPTAEG